MFKVRRSGEKDVVESQLIELDLFINISGVAKTSRLKRGGKFIINGAGFL